MQDAHAQKQSQGEAARSASGRNPMFSVDCNSFRTRKQIIATIALKLLHLLGFKGNNSKEISLLILGVL